MYTATFADGIHVAKSPKWIADRLIACGLRPINNVVDVMNYVMLELGQPLHAFDADLLRGTIIVRSALRGEQITTLDEQKFTLTPEMLIIADAGGPLAIAGVKGGKRAEVGPDTKKIVIESASFDSTSVYKTSRRLNLATDASIRFGHGLNPAAAPFAAARAAQILKEVGAAKSIIGMCITGAIPKSGETIDINLPWLSRFLGITFSGKDIKKLLAPLGFSVFPETKSVIRVEAPNLRSDIELPEDIAEEIARMYGYNNIPSEAPRILPSAESNVRHDFISTIRSTLVALSYSELYTHSFVPASISDHKLNRGLKLENPISSEYAGLRASLYHNLVTTGIQKNLHSAFRDTVKIFEIGTIFTAQPTPFEEMCLGIAIARAKSSPEDIYRELKGVIDALSYAVHAPLTYEDEFEPPSHMHAPHIAHIKSGAQSIGYIGIPSTRLGAPCAFAELSISRLMKFAEPEIKYAHPPKYPAIERDISMFVPRKVRVADAEKVIRGSKISHLASIKLLDVYLPKEDRAKKSIAVRLTFRSKEKTLTESEIEREFEKVLSDLTKRIGAKIR